MLRLFVFAPHPTKTHHKSEYLCKCVQSPAQLKSNNITYYLQKNANASSDVPLLLYVRVNQHCMALKMHSLGNRRSIVIIIQTEVSL